MKLFSDETVRSNLERQWWVDDHWDAMLTRHATDRADDLALVDPSNRAALTDGDVHRLTWAEVDDAVDQLAAQLLAGGVRADTVVGVQLPNIAELCIAYLALARLGAIATPFPVQYREHELTELLELSGAGAFITGSRVLDRDNAASIVDLAERLPHLATVFAFGEGAPDGAVALTDTADPNQLAGLRDHRAGHAISSNDCITLCWTSGTESTPKGVPRAFIDWHAVGSATIDAPGITADDVILNPFPLVNMGAFGGLYCPWIQTGCTLVMHHPFDMPVFLGQITTERVDYTVMPPALMTRLLAEPQVLDQWDHSSLRTVGTGSAPVPGSTVRGWEDLGIEVINFFGANEGLNLISDRTSVPDPEQRGRLFPSYRGDTSQLRVRVGDHTTIRLVDPISGDDIDQPGQPGELRLAGPTVFAGYWEGTASRSAFDDDGYYRSGDLFEFADDSLTMVSYQGRSNDMIVRGGFNVSPAEIEGVLQSHPAVAEVAVIGIPDHVLGERIGAFVVAAAGTEPSLAELQQHAEAAQIAKYKWPEALHLIDALPRNPVGKVLHRELRDSLPA